ncbi:MAG: hypothetical protein BWY38_02844 [Ignavibacteria bacterium ADurb.Bin266]|nr:MAG: hypothetical protein BWY38_02844 [Ignavibacteria bacterium ADurb.Bin266]
MEPTFTYILSWPPDQYRRGKIQIISCYGDTTDTGWTTGGYATTSMPGRGHHIFNFINQRYYYDSHLGWGWYYDSNPNIERKVLVNNQVLNLGSILGSTMGTIDTPLLKMESFICDSGFVKMEVLPTRWAECEQIGWFPTDPISLRITQGEEFATIFNIRTETDLGNTALIDPFVRIEDLSFFFRPNWDQDGLDDIVIMPIDSNFTLPFTVVVEASINEVTFSNEIEFIPKSLIIETGVYPEVTTTGEQSYLDIYISGLCSWLSFETKINVEIISGQEYGNLIDPYTNEKIKTITNLDHWWGYAWVEFIADGNSTKQLDTITLRITTTDQAIMPNEALLIIKPPPIYVYTVPEVLGADDTADVIIQHRLEDGTLEDFPPDQTFELAVLDGCVNGNFMVGDSINVYFEDALQPIKFVTSDTLDSEVKNILIRVGTNLDEGGGGGISRPIGNLSGEEIKAVDTLRVGFEKMMAEKRAAAEKKENNEPPIEAPIVKQCALDEPTYTTYWKGFTSVGDECDIEECGDSYDDIQIEVVRQYNFYESGYFVVDSSGNTIVETKIDTVCFRKDSLNNVIPDSAMGQSRPLDYHRERKNQNGIYENAWHLKPCKNASGKIELRPVLADSITRTPIYIDFIADVCYTSITNDGLNLISDTTQLSDTTLVPDTVKIAKDICGHNCYPQLVSKNGFIIKEIVERHELLHMEHFKQILSDTKKDSLVNVLKKWVTYSCENYKRDKKQNSLDGSFDSELRAYISKAIRKYWLDHGHTLDAQGNPQIDKN